MKTVEIRDLLAGVVLLGLGLFLAQHIAHSLDMGTVKRPGPGAFPFAMALGLAGVGMTTMLFAFRCQGGTTQQIDWGAAATTTLSILVFAGLLVSFGLLVAVPAQLLVSSILDKRFSFRARLAYVAGLTAFSYLVFVVGLRIQVPILEWPW